MKPYRMVSSDLKNEKTLVRVKDVVFGGRKVVVIAGPVR